MSYPHTIYGGVGGETSMPRILAIEESAVIRILTSTNESDVFPIVSM